MERLLSEGEIAETWKSDDKGFMTEYVSTRIDSRIVKEFYSVKYPVPNDYDTFVTASIVVHDHTTLRKLTIYGRYSDYSNPIIEEFINEYKIEPYTYNFYVDSTTTKIPAWIKPFSIITMSDMPHNMQPLPFCVLYLGVYSSIKSALTERNEDMEYEVARRLQSVNMKSAMC